MQKKIIDQYLLNHKINHTLKILSSSPSLPSLFIGFPPSFPHPPSSNPVSFSIPPSPSIPSCHADIPSLPFPDSSLGTVILHQCLPFSQEPHTVLREVWRVLHESGSVLLIASSQRNRWLLSHHDPLKYQKGYSFSQVKKILNEQLFFVTSIQRCLHAHPLIRHLPMPQPKWAQISETSAEIIAPAFGGLILALAKKNIAQPLPQYQLHKKNRLSLAS